MVLKRLVWGDDGESPQPAGQGFSGSMPQRETYARPRPMRCDAMRWRGLWGQESWVFTTPVMCVVKSIEHGSDDTRFTAPH